MTKRNRSAIIDNVKRDIDPQIKGEFEMIVAIYRSNKRAGREQIMVTQGDNQMLHITVINASGENRISGMYQTLPDVEAYLKERNPECEYVKVA